MNNIYIGLGGAGSNIVEYIQQRIATGKFINISSPQREYKNNEIEFIEYIPTKVANNDTKTFVKQIINQKISIVTKISKIFIIAGFGGSAGTNLAIEFSNQLKDKYECLFLLILPFSIENKRRPFAVSNLKKINPNVKTIIVDMDKPSSEIGHYKIKDYLSYFDNEIFKIISNENIIE